MTSPAELTPSGVHEAGHIVVGYALGRRVTLIRLGRQMVPADHPHAELLQGSVTGGESRFGPALATEINYRVNTEIPLAADHLEWLRAELVTCFAGVLAETRLLGEMNPEGAVADLKQASIIIGLLGITADADGGAARLERAQGIAERVIAELSACVSCLTSSPVNAPTIRDSLAAHPRRRPPHRRRHHRRLLV